MWGDGVCVCVHSCGSLNLPILTHSCNLCFYSSHVYFINGGTFLDGWTK